MNATGNNRLIWTGSLCVLALFSGGNVRADEPNQPIPHSGSENPGQAGKTRTVAGVVKQFTTNDRGDVDGMILDDGTRVHWWPHLGKRFLAIASKGDSVRVTGRTATIQRGLTVLEGVDHHQPAHQGEAAERRHAPRARRRPGQGGGKAGWSSSPRRREGK